MEEPQSTLLGAATSANTPLVIELDDGDAWLVPGGGRDSAFSLLAATAAHAWGYSDEALGSFVRELVENAWADWGIWALAADSEEGDPHVGRCRFHRGDGSTIEGLLVGPRRLLLRAGADEPTRLAPAPCVSTKRAPHT